MLALPAGIALALGANIGTAVTTAIMGILSAKSTEAVRVAVVHMRRIYTLAKRITKDILPAPLAESA